MTNNEIMNEISLGEDSQRQFKANLHNPEQVAAEIVAFFKQFRWTDFYWYLR